VYDIDEVDLPFECSGCPTSDQAIFECESYTTAFQLTEIHYNTGYCYLVEPADYYMWWPTEELNNLFSGGVPGYGNIDGINGLYGIYNVQTHVPNNPGLPGAAMHRRMDGTLITAEFDEVWGIPKTKYLWCDNGPVTGYMMLNSLSGDLDEAMAAVNGSGSWDCDNLFCNEMFSLDWETTSGESSEDDGSKWDDVMEAVDRWLHEVLLLSPWDSDDADTDGDHDSDIWDLLNYEIIQYAELTANSNFNITNLDYLSIKKFGDQGTGQIIQYHKSDLVDINGNPTPPAFVLEKGLYEISFTINSGKIFRSFLPLKSRTLSDFCQSSYVIFNAFPVPVVGNSFDLSIQSEANLEFEVIVMDMAGNNYFRSKYDVDSGHDENHRISLINQAPNGVLIVKLLFGDGSQKSITVTKSS
jgi:hypothetical protein